MKGSDLQMGKILGALGDIIGQGFEDLGQAISEGWNDLTDTVSKGISEAWEDSWMNKAGDWIGDKVSDAYNWVSDGIEGISNQMLINDMIKEYNKTGSLDSITDEIAELRAKGYEDQVIMDFINANISPNVQTVSLDNITEKMWDYTNTLCFTKDTILGLPFRYNVLTDPRRRIYNTTFLADAPIVTLVPGLPQYRSADAEIAEVAGDDSLFTFGSDGTESFLEKFGINGDTTDEGIFKWLLLSQKNNNVKGNRDLRYYGFRPDYSEFLDYLDLAVATVATKMGILGAEGSLLNFKSYISDTLGITAVGSNEIGNTLKFYCDKSISVTENITNEFGASALAGTVKGVSDMVKEAQFVLGNSGALTKTTSKVTDLGTGKVFDSILSAVTTETTDMNLQGIVDAATKGYNITYPEIWKDSTFSKSYSVSFKFMSPYGTADAIFQHVYLPFLVLFCLACPRQYSIDGYMSPFILRADVPGYFTTDLAVITNLSWQKGGSDGLFNKDGLPLAIDVNMEIKDLYPMSALPRSYTLLRQNTGMHGFLDNMAGLSAVRVSPYEDLKRSLKLRTEYLLGTGSRVIEKTNDWGSKIVADSLVNDSGSFLGKVYRGGSYVTGALGDIANFLDDFSK